VVKRLSWALGVVLAVALTVGLTSGPAAAYRPESGATFNVPKPWGREVGNFKILRKVEKAIRNTRPTKRRPHPAIHVSTFLMDRPQSSRALIAACRRGVSVRVIIDQEVKSRPSRRLTRVLNADNVRDRNDNGKADKPSKRGPCDTKMSKKEKKKAKKKWRSAKAKSKGARNASVTWGADRSYVKRCKGSCRGAGGNMHSKFFVFSKTGKARHVVMVGSTNLNRGGAVLGWNDMYTITNRDKSYSEYVRIHRQMTNDRRAGVKKVQFRDGPYLSRFFPMRHATKRNDPTMVDLRKVRCRSPKGRTAINVSMFYWKGSRGNYIANKLLDLSREGCRVSIIYGAPSVQIAERLRNAARARKINLYDSRWDMNGDGFNEVRVHSKYILIKGRYGKDRKARLVLTGSQNWVAGSLSRGDETTLNISRKKAYREYKKHWKTVKKHSRRLPYHW
jgi:phosphatidylserine/phosphatidylglycerophosphate/cardiolipin synthase-like enzyme